MKKRQQGLTTVEAAIGAALMLLILFATIEIARVIFVWNFLDEVTRRGARVAAVCPMNDPAIAQAAIFAVPGSSDTQSPHVGLLTTDKINVDYWDADKTDITNPDDFEQVRFVHVSIDSFNLPLLAFSTITLNTPVFRTILPSESLGYNPDKVTDPPTFECVF